MSRPRLPQPPKQKIATRSVWHANIEWVYEIRPDGEERLLTKRTHSDHIGDLEAPVRDTPRAAWRRDIIPDALIDAPYPRVDPEAAFAAAWERIL